MTVPKGMVSTTEAAVMLGFKPDIFGRQYLSIVARYSGTFPPRHGVSNVNLHYNKAEVAKWVKNNDVKAALKHARQMCNGKKPLQEIDPLQQLRLNFLTGKLQGITRGKNRKAAPTSMDRARDANTQQSAG